MKPSIVVAVGGNEVIEVNPHIVTALIVLSMFLIVYLVAEILRRRKK